MNNKKIKINKQINKKKIEKNRKIIKKQSAKIQNKPILKF